MDYPVAKRSGKHLALLRVLDDEACRRAWLVRTCPQLIGQFLQVQFQIFLEPPLIRLVALVPASVSVGLVKVLEQLMTG